MLRPDGSIKHSVVTGSRYYPHYVERKMHDDFRILFEHIYSLQDQLKSTNEKLDAAHSRLREHGTQLNGPSNSKINGLYVEAKPPSPNQFLRYDASTGQLVWTDSGFGA